MEYRHYLRAHGLRLSISGRHTRLVPALRAQLAAFQHARRGLLLAGSERRPIPPRPRIFLFLISDQNSQFTSLVYEPALLAAGYRISRDGRGRALILPLSNASGVRSDGSTFTSTRPTTTSIYITASTRTLLYYNLC